MIGRQSDTGRTATVLSCPAGHGSMLLYSAAAPDRLCAADASTICATFRQIGSPVRRPSGEFRAAAGIEVTTGPLGQGIAMAVGFALAERHLNEHLRRRSCRSPHLGDRRRRLPDGGHQPRGVRAGRPPEARPADRAVGRQPHHHRRRCLAEFHQRGCEGALSRRPMAGTCTESATGTIRPTSIARCARRRPMARPSLVACRTHDRLWRAEQAGHARRRTDRPSAHRRDCGGARRRWLGPTRRSTCLTRFSPAGARPGRRWRRGARRVGAMACRSIPSVASNSSSAEWPAMLLPISRASRSTRISGGADRRSRSRSTRHPHRVATRAGSKRDRRDAARDCRRLGRPDAVRTIRSKPKASRR